MTTAAERAMEMASVAQSEATLNRQQGQALAQRVAALEQQMEQLSASKMDELARQIQGLCDAAFLSTHASIGLLERIKRLEERLGMEP